MKLWIAVLWTLAAAAHAQPTLDLRAWLDEVAAATAGGACDGPFGACLAQAEALDAATGWSAGCTEDVGRTGDRAPGWGTVEVTWLAPDEALVSLGCAFWAYQGGSVVLHVASERDVWRARLLAFPVVLAGDDGAPPRLTATTEVVMWMGADAEARTGVVFGKARGVGDCGLWSVYAFERDGPPVLREARARGCDEEVDLPEDAPVDPASWPVIYPE